MDELDTLLVRIRADTGGFARDVATMRSDLEGPLATGIDTAGKRIETSLAKAIAGGRVGFDDLRKVAVAALADIAANAVKADLGSLFGGAGGGGLLSGLFGSLFGGAPGRATGGPVAPGRPYMVGERGPELFVPTSAGSIAPTIAGQRGPVSITVNVAGPAAADSAFMARTGEQVARAVRRALDQAGS